MIRNEAEYQEASKRLGDELRRLDEHRARLKESGLGDVEVKHARACGHDLGRDQRAVADPGSDGTVAAVSRRAGIMMASSRGRHEQNVSAETHIY
jgi:hypothetical protein